MTTPQSIGQPKFINSPLRRIAGYNRTYRYENRAGIEQQWREFIAAANRLSSSCSIERFGVYWNCSGNRHFDFLTGLAIGIDVPLPTGWQVIEVPAGRYAVFCLNGRCEETSRQIDDLWRTWAQAKLWRVKGSPSFELHIGDADSLAAERIEYWIPVDIQPLEVIRGDITALPVAAIVNAANETLLGGGGVDGAIHRAAGPELVRACRAIPEIAPQVRCPTGQARITSGFRLPALHVIHTVGPVWRGGQFHESELLAACYRNALQLAADHQLSSVAFPAISCGAYGYPVDEAARIAVRAIRSFQTQYSTLDQVFLVAFSGEMEDILRDALAGTVE